MNWQQAMVYCKRLELADFSNWHLPDKDELKFAYKIKSRFPEVKYWYWASTDRVDDADYAWGVDFHVGIVDYHDKSDSDFVRCVRSGR